MGGIPGHTHLSLAVPDTWTEPELLTFMKGYKALADKYSVSLIGGDLSRSPDQLVIIAVVDGLVSPEQVITRTGAEPGDIVWVSGTLGEAAAGLQVLKRQLENEFEDGALNTFLKPVPEIELGRLCAESGSASAMIDLSDGLAGDLGHILKASEVGAVIFEDQLPISTFTKQIAARFDTDVLEYALRGGEDYHLLGCTPESAFSDILGKTNDILDKTICPLGRITKEPGLRLQSKSGSIKEISPTAHDHFASK
jgi:thiamine-monophosphate kinase